MPKFGASDASRRANEIGATMEVNGPFGIGGNYLTIHVDLPTGKHFKSNDSNLIVDRSAGMSARSVCGMYSRVMGKWQKALLIVRADRVKSVNDFVSIPD